MPEGKTSLQGNRNGHDLGVSQEFLLFCMDLPPASDRFPNSGTRPHGWLKMSKFNVSGVGVAKI